MLMYVLLDTRFKLQQRLMPSALVVHPGTVGGGPRRRDALDAHCRWRCCCPGGDELGEVDPVHLAGVLRHDVLDHVDPATEARRADVARNLVLVVLEAGRTTCLSHTNSVPHIDIFKMFQA